MMLCGKDFPICGNCKYYDNNHGGICLVNYKPNTPAIAPTVKDDGTCKLWSAKNDL